MVRITSDICTRIQRPLSSSYPLKLGPTKWRQTRGKSKQDGAKRVPSVLNMALENRVRYSDGPSPAMGRDHFGRDAWPMPRILGCDL